MSSTLLAASGLTVGRGAPVLTGVDLVVRAGECWFVVGRNGAGKSTLLATLLGLLPALGGRVHAAPTIADRSGLGYVPQEPPWGGLLPITASEFVALGLADRLPRAEARRRAGAALAAIGLGDAADRPLGETSLGQRRRALVARALVREPQLLVLDEPLANLDAHGAAALARDLERLRRAGLAIVHAAHDLAIARAFATHVAFVEGGRVLAAAAHEAFAAPALQRFADVGAP